MGRKLPQTLNCCISEVYWFLLIAQGQSWGNFITGSGESCPEDAVAITMNSSAYPSLLSSAISQLGISTVPAASATASVNIVSSAPSTAAQGNATSEAISLSKNSLPSSSPSFTSTSTGAGGKITPGALPAALLFGAGTYLIWNSTPVVWWLLTQFNSPWFRCQIM